MHEISNEYRQFVHYVRDSLFLRRWQTTTTTALRG